MRVSHASTSNAASATLDIAHGHVHADAGDVRCQLVVLHNQLRVPLTGRHLEATLLNVLHLVIVNVLLLGVATLHWSTYVRYWAHIIRIIGCEY